MNKKSGIKKAAAVLLLALATGMLTSCLPYLNIDEITLPPETSGITPEITTAEETTASPETTAAPNVSDRPTETTSPATEAPKSGCGSLVGALLPLLSIIAGGAVLLLKRKEL